MIIATWNQYENNVLFMLAFMQSLCDHTSCNHTSHMVWLMYHRNSFLRTVEAEKSKTKALEDLVSIRKPPPGS